MWSAWSDVAALLALFAAAAPYAAVITGYGIVEITDHVAAINGCVIANGTLIDLWIGRASAAVYSLNNELELVLTNGSGVYTAVHEADHVLGIGEDGRLILYSDGLVTISGMTSLNISGVCQNPLSAKVGVNDLGIACEGSILYYRFGSGTTSSVRLPNVTAVLGVGNGVILARLSEGVAFVDITEHRAALLACSPVMWGVGDAGLWVACKGSHTRVFLYSGGVFMYGEVNGHYRVCSTAGNPCKVAANSLYVEDIVFRKLDNAIETIDVPVNDTSVTVVERAGQIPDYSRVSGECLTVTQGAFIASGEPIPIRLLVGAAMIVSGLISVLVGYRLSKRENVSAEG